MELRQRILDLYHQCSLSGLAVTLHLWYTGAQEFFTFTNSPLPLSRDSLSLGWNRPGETKNTNSDLKPVEKDKEEKRNMEPQDQFLQ